MKPVTPQKVRAVLKKAGFLASKGTKDRISWHWSFGYRIINDCGLRVVHCGGGGIETPRAWCERYRTALYQAGIVCEIAGNGQVLVSGYRFNEKKPTRSRRQLKLL